MPGRRPPPRKGHWLSIRGNHFICFVPGLLCAARRRLIGRVLSDRFLSTLLARQLASRFGGDRGSCDWRHLGRLAGFTNQKKERRFQNGFQPFVEVRSCEGHVYSRAAEFLLEVEALNCTLLSQRELRKAARLRLTDALVRPLASFHADSRYGGDLHRADMAWAIQAAARGLSPGKQVRQRPRRLFGRRGGNRVVGHVYAVT